MSAGWLRLDALAPRSGKIAVLKTDSLRWLWIVTLCEAKLQRPSGRFGSRVHWQAVTGGKPAGFRALVEAGLLHETPEACTHCEAASGPQPNGVVLVHDWHEFQMDPSTERVRRHRQKGASDLASNRTVSLYKERTGVESVNDIIARVAERSVK